VLIEGYDLEILTPPCDPGAERFFAKAHLAVDISDVLPYLNGTLSGASFTPAAKALTWQKDGHKVAFHSFEINISAIESREWAEDEINGLVDLVNRTWTDERNSHPASRPFNASLRWRSTNDCPRPTVAGAVNRLVSISPSNWWPP